MIFLYAGDARYEQDAIDALKAAGLKEDALVLERVEDLQGALASFNRPKWFRDSQKALIVLDLDHSAEGPRQTVEAVMQQVRRHTQYKGIPVVVMSGTMERDDVLTYYGMGVNACVRRPIEPAALAEVLSSLRGFWLERAILPEGGS